MLPIRVFTDAHIFFTADSIFNFYVLLGSIRWCQWFHLCIMRRPPNMKIEFGMYLFNFCAGFLIHDDSIDFDQYISMQYCQHNRCEAQVLLMIIQYCYVLNRNISNEKWQIWISPHNMGPCGQYKR